MHSLLAKQFCDSTKSCKNRGKMAQSLKLVKKHIFSPAKSLFPQNYSMDTENALLTTLPDLLRLKPGRKVSMYGSEKRNEIFFKTIKTFFPKLCLWTHRMPFFRPRQKTLRQTVKSFLLLVSKGKIYFSQKTISSKWFFGQLKSNSENGFEKLSAKGRNIISKCPKTIEKQDFFKQNFSSHCSQEHVDCICDTLRIFFQRTKNHFLNVRKRRKRRFSQTYFKLKPSFRTCRLPSWHPVENFLPNAGKFRAHFPKVWKTFSKIFFSWNAFAHTASCFDKPAKKTRGMAEKNWRKNQKW